ncbi:ABC transporter ATP-binding protein [Paenibacillus sp. IB182496]|uniref:ABC transporter ATP-binding protein n=1 Tax=Paenibacillus sabuli TaxID=2772509 RepID=A0A927BUG4_9BACL|nr:ABC transporter ATP-binding protein [Paenibacillus sabuli]
MPKAERTRLVTEIADTVGLTPHLRKKPEFLSGGERQRVALARAMVKQPAVFLMDEPLSNLDAKLRQQMRMELIELHARLGATFVYVTHDQVEAMSMGTRIVLMNHGRIMQADTPHGLYHDPANLFACQFIGTPPMNVLELTSLSAAEQAEAPPGATYIGFRPEKARLLAPAAANGAGGTLTEAGPELRASAEERSSAAASEPEARDVTMESQRAAVKMSAEQGGVTGSAAAAATGPGPGAATVEAEQGALTLEARLSARELLGAEIVYKAQLPCGASVAVKCFDQAERPLGAVRLQVRREHLYYFDGEQQRIRPVLQTAATAQSESRHGAPADPSARQPAAAAVPQAGPVADDRSGSSQARREPTGSEQAGGGLTGSGREPSVPAGSAR